MKKLIPIILFLAMIAACNNSADSIKTKDSLNVKDKIDNNNNNETGQDTSSYDRMSNKTSDSTKQ